MYFFNKRISKFRMKKIVLFYILKYLLVYTDYSGQKASQRRHFNIPERKD